MKYQIQHVTKHGKEIVDETNCEQDAIYMCREYSIAFGHPCIVVREDESDFIRE